MTRERMTPEQAATVAEWRTDCRDWGERLKKGKSIIPPPIFPEEAEYALSIFKELKIVDALDSPTFGEASAQWVFDLVACIFGAYDRDNGRRLITEFFVLIPKKNSKSTLAAGIMVTAILINQRLSAEFNIIAPTVEVANNSFKPSKDMIEKEDELSPIFHVQQHIKTITHHESGATLKVIAAASETVSGKKGTGTLIDELWLFGKMKGADDMIREAIGGLASRPEGFVIYLTTQSNEPPAGVFKTKLQYARDVRDGKIHDPQFCPIIFEHPADMVKRKEHLLAENLAMVNPNLGKSVDEPFLLREFRKAKEEGEESLRGFLAKHANVQIGINLQADRWAGADYWEDAGVYKGATLDELLDMFEVADVGIDGGGMDDLLGLSVTGRLKGSRNWVTWVHAWAHKSVFERRKTIETVLLDFEKDGDLTVVKRIGEDVLAVAKIVKKIYDRNLLDLVGCDPAGIGGVLDALEAEGIPKEKVVAISQGWKLSGSIKTTERRIAAAAGVAEELAGLEEGETVEAVEGSLWHCGQPLLAWCVGNARVVPIGNAVNITKQVSGKGKIDALMAVFDSVSLLALNPEIPKPASVYEARGIRFA